LLLRIQLKTFILENIQNKNNEIFDLDKFKEDWEDQEIADNFEQILKQELKL